MLFHGAYGCGRTRDESSECSRRRFGVFWLLVDPALVSLAIKSLRRHPAAGCAVDASLVNVEVSGDVRG